MKPARTRLPALLSAVAVAALGATTLATPATANTFTLTVAAGQPPAALPSLAMVRDFFIPEVDRRLEESGTGYSIRWREAYAGALLQPQAMLQGIADGIADIGYIPTLFYPDRLPLEQVSLMAPFCTDDLTAVTAAMAQLYADIPAMAEQYEAANQIRLAGSGLDSYHLHTTAPVRSLDDLDGKRIGAAGASLSWLRGTPVAPVQSNMMEYYNSTRTGVYDGFIIMASTIPGMRYPEAAPYVNLVDFGAMYAVGLTINRDSLARLPQEVQDILAEVALEWGEVSDQAYITAGEDGLEALPGFEGAQMVEFPQDERVRWAQGMPNIAREWAERQDAAGLPGTEVLEAYMAALSAAGIECARDWAAD